MTVRRLAARITGLTATLAVLGAIARPATAQQPPAVRSAKEIRWVRDSEEYATLTRMVYRMAARAVDVSSRALPRGRPWAVVLDVAQTALDDAVYQLELQAYGIPHDTMAYGAWRAREEADAVPGVVDFVAGVRRLGGRVVWITNDQASVGAHLRANLAKLRLWSDSDLLCLATADRSYTKGARRTEVAAGSGACSWPGQPVSVLAFVGDGMGDFPALGEPDPEAGSDSAFGSRYFLLPNPMYGAWENRVTRRR